MIIEGGAKLLQSFIEGDQWDEARLITNTSMTIGEGIAAPVLQQQQLKAEETINTDTVQYFINKRK